MGDNILSFDKFRTKKKRSPMLNQQEETDLYINEFTDEFNKLLDLEKKGGEKNERIRKNDREKF